MLNLGLYLAGENHDGAVQDVDLFCSALDISTAAIDRTDALVEAATLAGTDRGKTVWEQLAVGAGTDTVDPEVWYDVVGVPSTSCATADTTIVLEAYYTAGD